jgi:hypothetical protein
MSTVLPTDWERCLGLSLSSSVVCSNQPVQRPNAHLVGASGSGVKFQELASIYRSVHYGDGEPASCRTLDRVGLWSNKMDSASACTITIPDSFICPSLFLRSWEAVSTVSYEKDPIFSSQEFWSHRNAKCAVSSRGARPSQDSAPAMTSRAGSSSFNLGDLGSLNLKAWQSGVAGSCDDEVQPSEASVSM